MYCTPIRFFQGFSLLCYTNTHIPDMKLLCNWEASGFESNSNSKLARIRNNVTRTDCSEKSKGQPIRTQPRAKNVKVNPTHRETNLPVTTRWLYNLLKSPPLLKTVQIRPCVNKYNSSSKIIGHLLKDLLICF